MDSEATQTVTVYDVLAWVETNKKALLIGFAAAVVIGFGMMIYRYNADQREVTASDALLQLKASVTPDATNQVDAAEFLNIAKQYPGTTAADRALLLAAGAMFAEGKYADAQAEFKKFQQERPQSPFAATAAYGVAASLDAQGNRDGALTEYQNLSVRYPNSSVLDNAKLAIARIYEAKNQPEQALRIYDELTKGTAMNTAASDAMSRRSELVLKHPELVKTTNAPTASVTLPSTNLTVTASTNAPPPAATNTPAAEAAATNAAPASTNTPAKP
jgi:predicted negative regulator of RcsB-dependent stress response